MLLVPWVMTLIIRYAPKLCVKANLFKGVNNAFLVKTRHKMALLYNDASVNENHHCSHVFMVTHQAQRLDIFQNLSPEEYEEIRKITVRLILATDMAKVLFLLLFLISNSQHFQYLTQFKAKVDAKALDNLDPSENRITLLEMAIKCADLNNPSKIEVVSRRFVDMVMEEFFGQGDQERNLGIPISQFMDRHNINLPKCQVLLSLHYPCSNPCKKIGFIDILVSPLFESWVNFNAKTESSKYHSLMGNIQANRNLWVSQSEVQSTVNSPPSARSTKFDEKNQSNTSVPALQSISQSFPERSGLRTNIDVAARNAKTLSLFQPKVSSPELLPSGSSGNMKTAIIAGKNVSSSNLIKSSFTNPRRSIDRGATEFTYQNRRQSMFAKTVTIPRSPPDAVTIEMEGESNKDRRPSVS